LNVIPGGVQREAVHRRPGIDLFEISNGPGYSLREFRDDEDHFTNRFNRASGNDSG
jgi:hypothetical protein